MWTVKDGIKKLKGNGAKITSQRIAILEHMQGRTDHPSADTLYHELLPEHPTMSVATVYSTAQLMAEAGLIKVLSIDDKRVYFDPTTATHGHFLCRKCGKLIDIKVNEGVLFKSAISSKDSIGKIERSEIFLYGLCSECDKD
jgi:Fur family peroxide stress response transcriptional regulator